MRKRGWFLGCLLLVVGSIAQTQSTPEGAVRVFLDVFNSGDAAKAASMNSSSGLTIIDEFAPYSWTGAKAFGEWSAGFDAHSKALGITEPKVALSTPLVRNVTGDQAYLIFPALYTYKEKNVAMREDARMAIVLRKEAGGWKIAAWSWTGTVPKPAR